MQVWRRLCVGSIFLLDSCLLLVLFCFCNGVCYFESVIIGRCSFFELYLRQGNRFPHLDCVDLNDVETDCLAARAFHWSDFIFWKIVGSFHFNNGKWFQWLMQMVHCNYFLTHMLTHTHTHTHAHTHTHTHAHTHIHTYTHIHAHMTRRTYPPLKEISPIPFLHPPAYHHQQLLLQPLPCIAGVFCRAYIISHRSKSVTARLRLQSLLSCEECLL